MTPNWQILIECTSCFLDITEYIKPLQLLAVLWSAIMQHLVGVQRENSENTSRFSLSSDPAAASLSVVTKHLRKYEI